MRCKSSSVRTIFPYFFELVYLDITLIADFYPFLTCWITFDKVFLTLFTLFLQRLRGLGLVILIFQDRDRYVPDLLLLVFLLLRLRNMIK